MNRINLDTKTMKTLIAIAALATFSAPAFAESVEQMEVKMPADITAVGAADTARADILSASKEVCRNVKTRSTTLDFYVGMADYRSCVKATYTEALNQDASGTLLSSAKTANVPYLLASIE